MSLPRRSRWAWLAAMAMGTASVVVPVHAQNATADATAEKNPEHIRLAQEAIALYQQGKADEAIAKSERALKLAKQRTGPFSADTADQLWNLGKFHEMVGHFDEALKLYEQAEVAYEKNVGREHIYMAEVLMGLTRAHAKRERSSEGEDCSRRVDHHSRAPRRQAGQGRRAQARAPSVHGRERLRARQPARRGCGDDPPRGRHPRKARRQRSRRGRSGAFPSRQSALRAGRLRRRHRREQNRSRDLPKDLRQRPRVGGASPSPHGDGASGPRPLCRSRGAVPRGPRSDEQAPRRG